MTERVPESLLAALAALVKWFEATRIPSVVIGGVACSLLGRPRLTQDIDVLAMLPETDWDAAVEAAARFGIVPRIDNPLDFARRSRVLLLNHTESADRH